MTQDSTADGEAATDERQSEADSGAPSARTIEASAPTEFGAVQAWWGDGKGKTTAALGMGVRAAGHGYRVHLLQFMKGGTGSVEGVRGEYNAIAAIPGFTYEAEGQYGWHRGREDGDGHAERARAAYERASDILAASDVDGAVPLDAPPDEGVHMLVLDEILYAVDMGLLSPDDVLALIDEKPDGLELVLTGSHEKPAYLYDHADLVSHVGKERHPFDAGQAARKGTEF
jgi:cob(I)alamin adenosyltransferase